MPKLGWMPLHACTIHTPSIHLQPPLIEMLNCMASNLVHQVGSCRTPRCASQHWTTLIQLGALDVLPLCSGPYNNMPQHAPYFLYHNNCVWTELMAGILVGNAVDMYLEVQLNWCKCWLWQNAALLVACFQPAKYCPHAPLDNTWSPQPPMQPNRMATSMTPLLEPMPSRITTNLPWVAL